MRLDERTNLYNTNRREEKLLVDSFIPSASEHCDRMVCTALFIAQYPIISIDVCLLVSLFIAPGVEYSSYKR